MDPITTGSIVGVLGKYALDKLGKYAADKGAELRKEIGEKAFGTAEKLFGMVLERLGREPTGQVIAGEFENDPETYQKPVEKALDAEVKADPEFAAQLEALWEQYKKEAQEHAATTGQVYKAELKGSGAIAQGAGAIAAGAGGVAVGGSVEGGIRTGGPQASDTEQKPNNLQNKLTDCRPGGGRGPHGSACLPAV